MQNQSIPTATAMAASFACQLPEMAIGAGALHIARRALLDTVAVAIAGSRDEASRLIARHVAGRTAPAMATIWSSGERVPVEDAALVNGVMGHVLDYDDVSSPLRGHPSVVLWPALAALAEAEGLSYRRACSAFVVGLELMARLGRALSLEHCAKGWHATATIGCFGTTLACCRLLGLDETATRHALGIALAQMGGTRANFGAMAKSFQAGHAASAATEAALLARDGFTAGTDVLDGIAGFTALYCDGETLSDLLAGIGTEPFEIETSGLDVKLYPCCYATHRAITATLMLRERHGLTLADVESASVIASAQASTALIHSHPRTGLEGKFSMQYALAAALLDGRIGLSSFDDAMVGRAAVQDFLPRVASLSATGAVHPRWADVTLNLRNGSAVRERVEHIPGSVQLPITDEALAAKAADCLAFIAHPADTRGFAQAAIEGDGIMAAILAPLTLLPGSEAGARSRSAAVSG